MPPVGDPDGCGNGEEDQRPRQKHKVTQSDAFNIVIICSIDFYQTDSHMVPLNRLVIKKKKKGSHKWAESQIQSVHVVHVN